MTENEVNLMAFPERAESMVLFGSGYGFDHLAQAGWLRDKEIFYWGRIDTHGFAILDQLRSHFPAARPLLMDRATLMAHRDFWGKEDRPATRELQRLQPEEKSLYDDSRNDRLAPALRLEQERIASPGWKRYSRTYQIQCLQFFLATRVKVIFFLGQIMKSVVERVSKANLPVDQHLHIPDLGGSKAPSVKVIRGLKGTGT